MKVNENILLPEEIKPHIRQALSEILREHARQINHQTWEITSIAAASSVAHDLVLCSTGASTLSVTLLPALYWQDKPLRLKKIDAGVGVVVVSGTENIDGAASKTVSAQWSVLTLVSNGIEWFTA